MLRVRTVLFGVSSLVLLGACGSDGGGDTTPTPNITVPAEYPQLGAGQKIKVAAYLNGASFEVVTDESLGRGYLPTYGIVAEEAGGVRDLTVFGLWSLEVGTYSYPGLDVGVEVDGELFLSAVCEDTLPTVEIVGGSAPGVLWGTIEATLCSTDGPGIAALTARFTADAHESITLDDGSCMGSAYCDSLAAGDYACTNDAPGCVWNPAICLGASDHPECRDWDGASETVCESFPGCVYFRPSCQGDVVIPCSTIHTEFGCGMVNGCWWLPNN